MVKTTSASIPVSKFMTDVLWQCPESRFEKTVINQYLQALARTYGHEFANYQSLHNWSVKHPREFWGSLFSFFHVIYEGSEIKGGNFGENFLHHDWFPEVTLNYAENLLSKGRPTDLALLGLQEGGEERRVSYLELKHQVACLQSELKECLAIGDVLAAYMPNIPETVVAMLAATGLGATFTSTSCDFGVEGVLDRFSLSRPKVLVAAVSYSYNGKNFSQIEKLTQIVSKLPSLKKIILVDFLQTGFSTPMSTSFSALTWQEIMEKGSEHFPLNPSFVRLPFSHPLYIMYSSGTTGKPKCIVHSAGGTLLQHLKELGLHSDLTQQKKILYFTTCGWMMWNWLVSGLSFGSTVVLYEGSPGYPDMLALFKILNRHQIHIWGTSPKFLKAFEQSGLKIDFALEDLETILSTGAPLLPEQFDFVYQNIKQDVCLSSISGGTDIIGCFFLGTLMQPVRRGRLTCAGLGMDAVAINEQAQAVVDVEGELVCRRPFPSVPVGFLNDDNQSAFKRAYFEAYPGIWHHGDFVRLDEYGYAQVLGRSDATLNPGGVRIGTAEIYRQTETLPYVEDAICVGQDYQGDVRVLLFVKMRTSEQLTEARQQEIKTLIRKNTTPRHVPELIFTVADIPYTRSGKKMELAVMRLINHKPLTNIEAVANPEALRFFEQLNIC